MILQSQASTSDCREERRFSLRALLYAVTVLAIFFGLTSQFEVLGIALAYDVTIASLLLIAWFKPAGFPAGMYRRWTWGQLVMSLFLCWMLHATALPPVTFHCRSRAPLPGPAPAIPAQAGNASDAR